MADKGFTKDQLFKALKAEKVRLQQDVFDRIWRKLDNPSGCEFCGLHTKVGEFIDGKLFTKCCGHAVD